MRYLLLALAEIAVTTYCVVGVVRHPDDKPHGLNKVVWIFVLLLFPYVPDLAWLYLQWRSKESSAPRPGGPKAPDDDPEFLRWLNDQQRRRKDET